MTPALEDLPALALPVHKIELLQPAFGSLGLRTHSTDESEGCRLEVKEQSSWGNLTGTDGEAVLGGARRAHCARDFC